MKSEIFTVEIIKQVGESPYENPYAPKLWYPKGTFIDVIDYDEIYYKKAFHLKGELLNIFIEKSFCKIPKSNFLWQQMQL